MSTLYREVCLYDRTGMGGQMSKKRKKVANSECSECRLFAIELHYVRDHLLHHFHDREVNHSEEPRKG
jgi:hypothetical protein